MLNLWASVETGTENARRINAIVPYCVAPTMTKKEMTEYVTGHVMRHHPGPDRHIQNDTRHR